MDLPGEIISEILFYAHDEGSPRPLKGLQIAFTCTSLYQDLGPVVVACQTKLLLREVRCGSLCFKDSRGVSLQEDSIQRSNLAGHEISKIYFIIRAFENTDSIWSLHSLLSRDGNAKQLSGFHLRLKTDPSDWGQQYDGTAQMEWGRALLKLFDLVMAQGLQFEFAGSRTDIHDISMYGLDEGQQLELLKRALQDVPGDQALHQRKHGSSGATQDSSSSTPVEYPLFSIPTFDKTHLTSLKISGSLFDPTSWFYLDYLTQRSSHSLTHLILNFSKASNDDWVDILPTLKFQRVSDLTLGELSIHPQGLATLLDQNPSISTTSIRTPNSLAPRQPWAPPRGPRPPGLSRYRLSGIKKLTCYPRVLLSLFQTSFSFPNLEYLEVTGYNPREGFYCHLRDITSIFVYLGQDGPVENQQGLDVSIDLPWAPAQELMEWLFEAGLSAREYVESTSLVKALKGLAAPSKSDSSSHCQRFDPSTVSLAKALRRLYKVTSLTLTAQEIGPDDDLVDMGPRTIRTLEVPTEAVVGFFAALPSLRNVSLNMGLCDSTSGKGNSGLDGGRRGWDMIWALSGTLGYLGLGRGCRGMSEF